MGNTQIWPAEFNLPSKFLWWKMATEVSGNFKFRLILGCPMDHHTLLGTLVYQRSRRSFVNSMLLLLIKMEAWFQEVLREGNYTYVMTGASRPHLLSVLIQKGIRGIWMWPMAFRRGFWKIIAAGGIMEKAGYRASYCPGRWLSYYFEKGLCNLGRFLRENSAFHQMAQAWPWNMPIRIGARPVLQKHLEAYLQPRLESWNRSMLLCNYLDKESGWIDSEKCGGRWRCRSSIRI